MATPKDVAEYMLRELKSDEELHQNYVVHEIEEQFGEEFVYVNENGNLAIDPKVLKEFRKLTEGKVVWDRGNFLWRFREPEEDPSKRQVDY